MNDNLGDRMKKYYENRFRIFLPRRTNTLIRLDGKAFHAYTKGLQRPYDSDFMTDMDNTAKYLCENIQGAKFAYVQSDEITILLTDYDDLQTEAWFDGNLQKIASISASLATAKFNHLRTYRQLLTRLTTDVKDITFENLEEKTVAYMSLACFDARVMVIPEMTEVHNNFIWRQQDATRNSIQMAAQTYFSHNELQGVNSSALQEKLFQEKGINWNDYPTGFKRGRGIVKRIYQSQNPLNPEETVYRSEWVVDTELPIFTQNRDYLVSHTQKPFLNEKV